MLNHTTKEDITVLHAELVDDETIVVKVQIDDNIGMVWLRCWEPFIVPATYSPYRLEILVELSNYIEIEEKTFRNQFENMRMKILTFG
ncbi:hypothetical protein [Neobacillus massiliamazoniensis]|jgi:hypothetical protein|uniref:Uncharacterized protein n=1 Tax=Neobacillus massiliamazoniensis TaxID=1499688 RepID=A0A0U1P4F1_9BACI|nr:hypothetical protein [Neobacillus massiliamazoniensis]CRK85071.1 hypothetical protein BN000_05130 [Neobacillus massiliamazoniensis]